MFIRKGRQRKDRALHKLFIILRDFSAQMKKQNISAFAASTAFFLVLSIVPMLILICTIIPYTPLTEENLVRAVTEITPDRLDSLVEGLIAEVYEKSAGILSVAAITTLWSAGKGVLALMRGLNAIGGVEEDRNYFVVRLVASLYTVVMLVVLILSLFIMVFGNQLVELLLYRVPQLQILVSFLMNFRFLLVWAILTLLFSAVYAYVPNEKLAFGEQVPGAAFAAVVWSVFSWGFSLYVERTESYSIYGSLSLIVIVMVWMYFCMYIIMIGAYLNRYFRPVNRVLANRHRQDETSLED
ncbi:MAG TPA: YihY/virulence factor BrkB family protein [Candidatus Acetatifactor stercoripullorum]|uniref:YihY/virulence factor BrkB family protein n=2 Tax=Candidatus Acetatifactor stercoripullorum TaxID=2838414 RepID=A0A9D1R3Y8_9FIRM|nr:YihY/virulence factor BrkB family protein [Candidatus Acetatifactor stercoripullorum]